MGMRMKGPSQTRNKWEVRNLYWNLYRKKEVVMDWDEIKRMTGHVKMIFEAENIELESDIKMCEVSQCLKNTQNNVAPGSGGFSSPFTR